MRWSGCRRKKRTQAAWSGTIKTVRFLKGEPPKEQEKEEETLTEQEQAILDTAINVDYLVCMKELEI